jgi:aminopeptidase
MPENFTLQADALAHIIVRVGLSLQPGQRLLVAEPYELQGVSRHAEKLVGAVFNEARSAGAAEVDCIWGDEIGLRLIAENEDFGAFEQLVAENARRLTRAVGRGCALLFLESVHPRLTAGLPASTASRFRTIAWRHFGPVAQRLMRGETNWTVAPAPTPDWADIVYPDLIADIRLGALWADVLTACRIGDHDSATGWTRHLANLRNLAVNLNRRHLKGMRFRGPGTDLSVALPSQHVWRTADLVTTSGLPFVANLPTEEIFSLPHRDSAEGAARVARPVSYGGEVIDGIELEFGAGRVVRASARTGAEQLRCLLETDDGASRLGEVAWVPRANAIGRLGRFFRHPLLDENALPHIALGDAYPFTLRDGAKWSRRHLRAAGANQSLIHVDLPLEASEVIWCV